MNLTPYQVQAAVDRGQHAQGQAIDFQHAEGFEVFLVPLDDRALGHGGVFHRHQAGQRRLRDHEPADVLRQVAGEADDGLHQVHQLPDFQVVQVEALLADALREAFGVVPPGGVAGQLVDLGEGKTQRLADVADGAARAVGDDGSGQRGALTSVLAVDVLDDFLAPLVLEIDIDVGRLVAVARDETLEQHAHAGRVDLGDAQAVTDRRVGRRAAALAQDAPAAGELDDIVDGQEVGFVAQLLDQGQFFFDLGAQGGRNGVLTPPALPASPALADAGLGELPQVSDRAHALGHHFARVAVVELLEAETAALGDGHARRQQFAGKQLCQAFARAQVALAAGQGAIAELRHRAAMADGRQRVVQHAPRAQVHLYVTAGSQGQPGRLRSGLQPLQAAGVVRPQAQACGQPAAPREIRSQPVRCQQVRVIARQPQGQAALQAVFEGGVGQGVFTLGCVAAAARDEGAEFGITGVVPGQQHQARAVFQAKAAARNQLDGAASLGAAPRFRSAAT